MRALCSLLAACSLVVVFCSCKAQEASLQSDRQAVAATSTSDGPPRGVEPENPRTIAPPPDAGASTEGLPGAIARAEDRTPTTDPHPLASEGTPRRAGPASDAALDGGASAGDGGAAETFGVTAGLDGGTSEDLSCQTDADCAATNVRKGDCCPMLCNPRAVTKARAAQLAGRIATCPTSLGHPCPAPLCRPTGFSYAPACVEGRCALRAERGRGGRSPD